MKYLNMKGFQNCCASMYDQKSSSKVSEFWHNFWVDTIITIKGI